MKRVKALAVVTAIQAVLLVAAIVACVLLVPGLLGLNAGDMPPTVVLGDEDTLHNGLAQVTDFGATPDDDRDDTAAFKAALKTGASVYIPGGKYNISENLTVSDRILKGAGNTTLCFTSPSAGLTLEGSAILYELGLTFSDKALDKGDCVAVTDGGMTAGSLIRGVTFQKVGTGIKSHRERGTFCATIESVTFKDYKKEAISISDGLSTIIRSATVYAGGENTPITLGGNVTVDSLSFEGVTAKAALALENCHSASINSLHFSEVKADTLVSCSGARFTLKSATLASTTADSLVAVADKEGAIASAGRIITVNGDIKISDSDSIVCNQHFK
ncbi:MAG: hypothetical protein J6B93_05145 [Clostridia bacterium]|nr:hypothetical protein [Clostridia bacterium]